MALNPNYIHLNATGVELWDYPNLSPTSGEILLTGIDGTADFPSDFTAATAATYNTSSLPVVYQFNFYKNASNRDRAKVEITNIYNVTNTDIFINSKVAPNVVNNVANTSETHTNKLNEGLEVKIIGTLANYDFTTVPTVNYTDLYGISHTVTATVTTSGNTKTATALLEYVNFNTNIVVNGVYEATSAKITVTTTEINCSVSGLPQTVYTNSVLNLTATAATNYEFTTAPTFNYTDSNNVAQSVNFTVAANGKTATLNLNLATLNFGNTTATITATAAAVVYPTLTVTTTEINCSVSGLPQTVYTNSVLNLTATAATNYEFTTAPTFNYTDSNNVAQSVNFTVAANGKTATLNLNLATLNFGNTTATITATAAARVPQTIELVTTAVNCVTDAPQYVNDTDTQITITATANANCEFDTAPILTIRLKNSSYRSIVFTIAQNKLTAVGTLNVTQIGFANIDTLSLYAAAEIVTPQFEKYGTINVYKVTTNNLADFAAQRFISYGSGDTANILDLGNYVNSIKRLYINVGECVNNVLKCGNHNTNIAVETPLNDVITVNCGAVAIPTPNNSNTDYNSEITLFLPFIGLVVVSSEFVGKTLNLAYKCNIIKGDAIAEITVNDVIMLQYECNVSYDVIYKTLQTQTAFNTVGNVDFNTQILKGLQPYAVLKYYTDKNAQIFNADCLRVSLSEISGYFAANEIENFVSNTITETEKEILFNEIANGVFILAV